MIVSDYGWNIKRLPSTMAPHAQAPARLSDLLISLIDIPSPLLPRGSECNHVEGHPRDRQVRF